MSLAHRTPGRILVICCPDLLAGHAAPEAPPPIAGPPPAPGPRPATGELPVDPVFAQVVAAIEDFSPLVEVIAPGRCAISAPAPARYFGGEQALLTKITSAISALGLTCRSGVADGLFAAQLAAQAAPPAPAQQPAFPEPHPPAPLATATQVVTQRATVRADPQGAASSRNGGPAPRRRWLSPARRG